MIWKYFFNLARVTQFAGILRFNSFFAELTNFCQFSHRKWKKILLVYFRLALPQQHRSNLFFSLFFPSNHAHVVCLIIMCLVHKKKDEIEWLKHSFIIFLQHHSRHVWMWEFSGERGLGSLAITCKHQKLNFQNLNFKLWVDTQIVVKRRYYELFRVSTLKIIEFVNQSASK